MALDGTTLNTTLTDQLGFITWWFEPEQNRGSKKYQIALGSQRFGLVHTSHLFYPVSLSLCHSVSAQQQLKKGIAEELKLTFFPLIC